METLKNLWLSFVLNTHLKRIDLTWEQPSPTEYDCCGAKGITIYIDYKWFWQKKNSSDCC